MPGKSGLKCCFIRYLSRDKFLIKLWVEVTWVWIFKLSSASFGKNADEIKRSVCFKIGLTVSFL